MQNIEWYLADLKSTGKNTIETVEKSLTDMFIRLVRIYSCLSVWYSIGFQTSDYYNRTEHGPHEQKPYSGFLQLSDHSFTCSITLNSNTVHVIGFQNHPEISWLVCFGHMGQLRAQMTKPWNIASELSMIGRPGCLLPVLAITNRQNPKSWCLQLRAAVAHRDLSKWGYWANCAPMAQSRVL